MAISRKNFLKGMLTLSVVGVASAACGDDETAGAGGNGSGGQGGSGQGGSGQGGSGQGGSGLGGSGQGGSGQGGTGSGGKGQGGSTAAACTNGADAVISKNHKHSLMVSAADIMAGVDKTYDIQGASSHSHDVTLTAAHFASLLNGEMVVVDSTKGGHTHTVTLSCA